MNKTQERALNWLIQEGHKKQDITFKQSSPCFFIKDKKYDVKRLYGNQIIFYNNQYKQLKKFPNTTILVFRDNESSPYQKINFSEIKDLPSRYKDIEINWVDISTQVRTLRISDKTKERLQEHGKMGEDFDNLINRLLDTLEKHERKK
ncbi:MAG: hypothetical protein CMH64_01395 [Nanoarchaeota archaeon]|nr:hypothetical protein [Nanoarchaeota archaeon]|tara:strand:+ start:890 stop:1333 length:444 start_codon:yes stop_codon:yes gene_type:complete